MFNIDLTGKIAWVTGASRGIGRAAALALAGAGCQVAVGYRESDGSAQSVCDAIRSQTTGSQRAIAVKVDVADFSSVQNAYKAIVDQLGAIDILVNNAGIVRDNLFPMLEETDWQDVLATNLMGVVNCTKAVVRDLMMKRSGRIINISSAAGTKGGRGQSNYAAAKGAVEAMSRSLAVELSKRQITVNCLAPGVIETDMSAEVRRLAASEILDRQLIKRFGTPEEIAAWIVFLASDFSGFMTGQVVHVDGGLKMS